MGFASALLSAMNERNWDALDDYTTEDVELLFPPGQVMRGRGELERFLRDLQTLVPDLTVVGTHTFAGRDHAVVEYESSGQGPAIEADSLGVVVMRFRDNRLSRLHLYVDTARWALLHRS